MCVYTYICKQFMYILSNDSKMHLLLTRGVARPGLSCNIKMHNIDIIQQNSYVNRPIRDWMFR